MKRAGDDASSFEGKKVVLCVGNRYMRDDGFGPEVYRRLRGLELGPRVVVKESVSADLATVWEFRSAKRLLVVDAVRSGSRPGTVSKFSLIPAKVSAGPLAGLHGLDLAGAVDLVSGGKALIDAVIVGVEPKDTGAGEGLSTEVEAAIPRAVNAVLSELRAGEPEGRRRGPKPLKAN